MNNTLEQRIYEFIFFYGAMGRASSCMEVYTRAPIPNNTSLYETMSRMRDLVAKGSVVSKNGFYAPKEYEELLNTRTTQDFYLDKKWEELFRNARWFRHIPFIDLALVSGSMSFGAIKPTSDFDIVLGVREGRLFTARYFVSFLFSLLRKRRLDDLEASSPNKFCFNHIVTPRVYEKEPHNYYRYELYRHMIPIFINGDSFDVFAQKNKWADVSLLNKEYARNILYSPSTLKNYLELLLGGRFGNFIENTIARPIAMKRLLRYIHKKETKGRVIVNNEELEFHFVLNYETRFSSLKIEH